jgi:hypothetical protein
MSYSSVESALQLKHLKTAFLQDSFKQSSDTACQKAQFAARKWAKSTGDLWMSLTMMDVTSLPSGQGCLWMVIFCLFVRPIMQKPSSLKNGLGGGAKEGAE